MQKFNLMMQELQTLKDFKIALALMKLALIQHGI